MEKTARIRSRISNASSIAVLTGAGISADSGVPTFRGQDGLWRNFKAEELATPDAFRRDPGLVWEWYNWRREIIATKNPNAAHHALVKLERHAQSFILITQNVDGLHGKAGSKNITEIHGNIWKTRCTACGDISHNFDVPISILPHCKKCNGLLRPHIVWFGESLDPADIKQSMDALHTCEVLLVIGTSGIVQLAASFISAAKGAGAYVVEINIEETPNSYLVDEVLAGRASDVVPLLVNRD
ncbi:MAG: NAD-dependent deacylase [Nitrospirae bacterium]|nr:NAD-dependent deacylase [Nitrospirota bacterium]